MYGSINEEKVLRMNISLFKTADVSQTGVGIFQTADFISNRREIRGVHEVRKGAVHIRRDL